MATFCSLRLQISSSSFDRFLTIRAPLQLASARTAGPAAKELGEGYCSQDQGERHCPVCAGDERPSRAVPGTSKRKPAGETTSTEAKV